MRCNNCGWDNPDGNIKCEKCNAPMSDYVNQPPPLNEYAPADYPPQPAIMGPAPDDFKPRITAAGTTPDDYQPRPAIPGPTPDDYQSRPAIPGPAPDDFQPRITASGIAPDDFNPGATAIGCTACGYPLRPVETECPVCGHPVERNERNERNRKVPVNEIPAKKELSPVGTIIRGAGLDNEKANMTRKKLAGFLVSYSYSSNGEFFPLYEGKNMIGRGASSHVCVKGDSMVSENHVSILYRAVDRKFKFKDELSSNGTFINGALIDEGVLKNYDMIRIGTTRLLFIEIPQLLFE